MPTREAIAAVNRFGLGAKPGEIEDASDPRAWLRAQLRGAPDLSAFSGLPLGSELLAREAALRRQRRQARADDRQDDERANQQDTSRRELQRDNLGDVGARYRYAATTARPFAERLVRFWSNHFAVSVDKGAARLYAAPMEREAIRPNLLGHFADLLVAVESHPAMLRYLDNAASAGDASIRVQRAKERGAAARRLGLNENLAREILELHTLGVDGGYTQADVTELARAITGWSTVYGNKAGAGRAAGAMPATATGFVFREATHEPGARSVLGRTYAQPGLEQGRAILRDLSLHPATARHLAFKLARHFVSDTPDRELVQRMARAYLGSGGELVALYAAMVDDDAAWSADVRKFKTPDDFVVSAMRAGGFALGERPQQLLRLLRDLGQPVFTPRSPEGYPDTFGDWAAGDALRKRLQVSSTLAARVRGGAQPLALARDVLGDAMVKGDFASVLQRAGSPQDGYALLFASPAFQWRA